MIKLIKSNGEVREIKAGVLSLEEQQKYVGGYVEYIRLHEDLTMIVNEDGRMKNLPLNEKASMIYWFSPIVGDVIICNNKHLS